MIVTKLKILKHLSLKEKMGKPLFENGVNDDGMVTK